MYIRDLSNSDDLYSWGAGACGCGGRIELLCRTLSPCVNHSYVSVNKAGGCQLQTTDWIDTFCKIPRTRCQLFRSVSFLSLTEQRMTAAFLLEGILHRLRFHETVACTAVRLETEHHYRSKLRSDLTPTLLKVCRRQVSKACSAPRRNSVLLPDTIFGL